MIRRPIVSVKQNLKWLFRTVLAQMKFARCGGAYSVAFPGSGTRVYSLVLSGRTAQAEVGQRAGYMEAGLGTFNRRRNSALLKIGP